MGRIDIVRYLISTGNVDIENVDIGGETPLFKVTSINQSMMIKSLGTEVKVALRPQISGRRK